MSTTIGLSGLRKALPAQPFFSPNPESPVKRKKQLANDIAGEALTTARVPEHASNTIKAVQPKLSPYPEITIGCLFHSIHRTPEETFTNIPGVVRILADLKYAGSRLGT